MIKKLVGDRAFYKKVLAFFDINPDVSIFKAYDDMLADFNEIRLSIDVITIENSVFILIYNFFSSELLCIKEFSSIKDPLIKEFFSKYINENLKLSVVISIRKDMFFIPMLKSICPANTKFIAYQKF